MPLHIIDQIKKLKRDLALTLTLETGSRCLFLFRGLISQSSKIAEEPEKADESCEILAGRKETK